MKVLFDSDFRNKIMLMSFEKGADLSTEKDVMHWKQQWLQALSQWHSPYKVICDCTNLQINAEHKDKLAPALHRLHKFMKGFFLKKAVIFGVSDSFHDLFSDFIVAPTEEEAYKVAGYRDPRKRSDVVHSFRDLIVIDNQFKDHVIDLEFKSECIFDSSEKIQTFKEKMLNNLMQWHSPWNLLIDCSNVKLSSELKKHFELVLKMFKGFHMKEVIGYGKKASDEWPFSCYRSRHLAVSYLESEGHFSGMVADCNSRKS